MSECVVRGVSVFDDLKEAENINELRLHKPHICKVTMRPGAGKVSDPNDRSHRTWWPYQDYPILANCTVVI